MLTLYNGFCASINNRSRILWRAATNSRANGLSIFAVLFGIFSAIARYWSQFWIKIKTDFNLFPSIQSHRNKSQLANVFILIARVTAVRECDTMNSTKCEFLVIQYNHDGFDWMKMKYFVENESFSLFFLWKNL